jgi:hypothetical protein
MFGCLRQATGCPHDGALGNGAQLRGIVPVVEDVVNVGSGGAPDSASSALGGDR